MQYVMTPYALPIAPWAWWEGSFTESELDWLEEKALSSTCVAQLGGGGVGMIDKNIRRSKITWMNNAADTSWVFEKLSHIGAKLNAEHFRFNLTGFGEALQLTSYDQEENGMYGWHQDYGGGISRKLSLVLQLTDPAKYEGGNLQVMTTGIPANVRKQRGLVAAFPSYVMHQVTPVTQGRRQSLVAWISGPAFQ